MDAEQSILMWVVKPTITVAADISISSSEFESESESDKISEFESVSEFLAEFDASCNAFASFELESLDELQPSSGVCFGFELILAKLMVA